MKLGFARILRMGACPPLALLAASVSPASGQNAAQQKPLMAEDVFTNVQVLYLPNNFGDDWVSKGYPAVKGK